MAAALFDKAREAHLAGRTAEAEAGYRKAIARGQEPRASAVNLGTLLNDQYRFAEARELLEYALRLRPDRVDTLRALGRTLVGLLDGAAAEPVLRRATELDPSSDTIKYRLGWALLMQGRYLEGWPWLEHRPSRMETNPLARARTPEWKGEPLHGKSILIWGEQGLGDEIQAARFVPWVRELGARRITLAVQAPNVRLLAQTGADAVIPRAGQLNVAVFDYWVLLWSLPGRLGVSWETVPGAPYLTPPAMSAATPPGGEVGVAWEGNPANPNDRQRSIPARGRGEGLPGAVQLAPQGDTLDSLGQLAPLSEVVAVDTAWAHLAGAMGKPVRVLLSAAGQDWRWLPGDDSSPWYPSAKLYRQRRQGDWTEVLAKVRQDLAAGSDRRQDVGPRGG
jgi:hypothetical protein